MANATNDRDRSTPMCKMSGYGCKSGIQQIEECLNVKAVWIKTA